MNEIRIKPEDISTLDREDLINILTEVFTRCCKSAEIHYPLCNNYHTMNMDAGSYATNETLKNFIQNTVAGKLANYINYYDNGEVITEERMEDETWYPAYQAFLHATMGCPPVIKEIMDAAVKDYLDRFDLTPLSIPSNETQAQFLRWAVLAAERGKNMPVD